MCVSAHLNMSDCGMAQMVHVWSCDAGVCRCVFCDDGRADGLCQRRPARASVIDGVGYLVWCVKSAVSFSEG
jgi:hypothetical protein